MKVAINYTVYIEVSSEIPHYVDYISKYHYEAMEQLDYIVEKATYGIHRNAKRHHIHYHSINVIPENVKIYKILNAKIKSLKINSLFPYQNFKIPEIKMSYHYEYDERAVLMYPLKEYNNIEIMLAEVDVSYLIGITDISYLEQLRVEANKRYQETTKEHEKKELMKKSPTPF